MRSLVLRGGRYKKNNAIFKRLTTLIRTIAQRNTQVTYSIFSVLLRDTDVWGKNFIQTRNSKTIKNFIDTFIQASTFQRFSFVKFTNRNSQFSTF